MANDLSVVVPKLLAQGLMALRGATILPFIVNRDYETEAAQRGATVTIPIPSAIAARNVVPGHIPVASPDIAPTQATIPLDQWKEAPFHLTDKDVLEAMNGVIPMQASEAVKALAEAINAHIFSKYKGVYGYVGTAGTTPFASDTTAATAARKTLNNQKAPMNPRYFVLNPDAEANALNLRAFQDYSWNNTIEGIRDGKMGTKLGFMWFMDQQVPTHTAGSLTGTIITAGGSNDAGDAAVTVATEAAEAVDLLEGDIITIAGHSQTYVVTADVSIGASTTGNIPIAPVLQATVADGAAVAVKASHVVNLACHRDAFAFASRPLVTSAQGLGNIIESMSDPVTGVTLRLEVSRQHKQTEFSYDVLWGSALVRRELATRVAG